MNKLNYFCLSICLILSACSDSRKQKSHMKLTSTKGIAYQATFENVRFLAGKDLIFNEMPLDEYRALMRTPNGMTYMNVVPLFQLGFIQGAMRAESNTTMNIGDVVMSKSELLDNDFVSGTYTATGTIFTTSVDASVSKDFWVPTRTDKEGLRQLIDGNPKCFLGDFEATKASNPEDYHFFAFYYFSPDAAGCSQDIKTDGTLQLLHVNLTPSPENPSEPKYPEYDKIWADQKLKLTLFFTPAKSLVDSDPGVVAMGKFAREMIETYGSPKAGEIPEDVTNTIYPKLTNHPNIYAAFQLPDGRELEINLHLRSEDWLKSDPSAPREITNASKTSDFLSYNGHSGYGMNIEKFQTFVTPEKSQHLMLFLNGCSTFGYLGRGLFKQSDQDQDKDIKRDIDPIATLNASFFINFAETNALLVKKLVERKDVYLDILKDIQKLQGPVYDASVVIRGEEDNVYVPKP